MSDETTDAVAEAREMIAEFERLFYCRTRYEGQPERADERYDRNRRALVARIDDLEAMCAAYADTIGKCNAENADLERQVGNYEIGASLHVAYINDLEAKLAAVTRERDRANDIIAAIDAGEVPQTGDVTGRDG